MTYGNLGDTPTILRALSKCEDKTHIDEGWELRRKVWSMMIESDTDTRDTCGSRELWSV